jgi:predicted DNA-binding protein (MmcQ/YjbR family)
MTARTSLLRYCLAKPGAWRDEPWDGDVVVKVGAKIFAFLGSPSSTSIGLKCGSTRDEADEWLLRFPDDATVMAYLGRSGWNSLSVGGAISGDELREAIDASYAAVVAKLPRRDRPGGPPA